MDSQTISITIVPFQRSVWGTKISVMAAIIDGMWLSGQFLKRTSQGSVSTSLVKIGTVVLEEMSKVDISIYSSGGHI